LVIAIKERKTVSKARFPYVLARRLSIVLLVYLGKDSKNKSKVLM